MSKKIFSISVLGIFLFTQALSAQTWQAAKRLTWNPGSSLGPKIAVDSSDILHLVWADQSPGNAEIYYKKSTDGGTSWKTRRLTWSSGASDGAVIATDSSDSIHVIWSEIISYGYELYHKKSTDGGASWTTKRLTWGSNHSINPSIAIDSSDNIHVVWNDERTGDIEIYYKKSTDNGTSWTTRRLTWNPEWSELPRIAIDSSNHIHVVWQDHSSGEYGIYYKKSTDGGTSWKTDRLPSTGSSTIPNIAIDSKDNINVIFRNDLQKNGEVFFKRSTDGGASWTTSRLTWNPGASIASAITTDSINNIHVVWFDWTPGSPEIYYKRSTNEGETWGGPQRLTWNPDSSYSPSIAIDSTDKIYLFWNDENPGNFEIYFRKGIQ